jgi:RNA polymerase sigma factor (TIGR02999 family)
LNPLLAMNDQPADNCSRETITALLNGAGAGNPQAAVDLLPLVYAELRALAARKMRQEPDGQTLQATALVHEAYLRLVGDAGGREWDGRWHFFAAAAEAMRRILVDNARSRRRLKRGGGAHRLSLEAVNLAVDESSPDLLALNEALLDLERKHPDKAQIVKLRYFAGLTTEEAARAMGVSPRTAGRAWSYARAWLYARINSDGGEKG